MRTGHYGAARAWAAVLASGLLVMAAPAAAIVITGGPTYTPGSGWSCTAPAAGAEKLAGGGNFTCSGTAGAFTNLYLGINRTTALPFGDKMDSTGGAEPSGAARFVWSANGATYVRYTGQTTIATYGTVYTRVTLTFSGSGSVVDDATTQALTGANINGSVHALWRIAPTVGSLSVNVLVEASDAAGGPWSPASAYFGTSSTHRRGTGSAELDRSHVDVAFYTSTCGDGQVDGSEQCDQGGANGAATSCCTTACQFRTAGQVCRTAADVCDVQETCTGASGACPPDAFASAATTCRAAAGVCDIAENCTGSSPACPADGKSVAVCRPAAGVCDVAESCDGVGNDCPADGLASAATVCRPAAGVCDVAENCTGSSPACPADGKSVAVCRAAAGVCDVAESCDGASNDCPADGFQSAATVCRPAADVCDLAETCTGTSAACPGDGFMSAATVCRTAAGVCDVAENCTGSSAACPADGKSTAVCRPAADVCDVAESCDGVSDNCPTDALAAATTVCRPEAGVCDVAENCTGNDAACPADAVAPTTTECRPVAGVCDVAESCDGSSVDCPSDTFADGSVTCRPVAGVCDVAEQCTGTGPNCPADGFESSAVVCRPASGVCDTAENCTGAGVACPADAVEPATTVCRPAAGDCDLRETCDGAGKDCPADGFVSAGTTCDDGDYCSQTDECDGSGTCVGSNPVDCDDVNPCTDDACDSQAGGFLCVYTNNGICIGANCGNFVVDSADGETCDPPDLSIGANGQPNCRLDCTRCGDGVIQANNSETCDDGNLISGCRTDKPQKPLDSCLNNCSEPICADPAKIKFGAHEMPDAFTFHGRLISDVPVDFIDNHFVIELRDSSGAVIYRASLVRGSIEVQGAKSTRYKNRGARAAGGIYQLKTKAGPGHYVLLIKAYGEMSGAVSDMRTHVYVGSDEWAIRGLWTKQGDKGWKLSNKATFLPVP